MSTSAATPHGVILGRRLQQVRQQHGDKVTDVVAKLHAVGATVSKDVLNKFEQGRRQHAPWDLALQLGQVYNLSALVFLLPQDGDELIEVAPECIVRARHLYKTLVGSAAAPVHFTHVARRPPAKDEKAEQERRRRVFMQRYQAQARHLAYFSSYFLSDSHAVRTGAPADLDLAGIGELVDNVVKVIDSANEGE